MFELLVAAKLVILAPQTSVGPDRGPLETRLGRPLAVGTDLIGARRGDEGADRVVTLDWQDARVRLYEAASGTKPRLIGVTVTRNVFDIDPPAQIGVDRATLLRALGGPAYEDEHQLIYTLRQESPDLPDDTVRFVLDDDRVIGIDWTFPLH